MKLHNWCTVINLVVTAVKVVIVK